MLIDINEGMALSNNVDLVSSVLASSPNFLKLAQVETQTTSSYIYLGES